MIAGPELTPPRAVQASSHVLDTLCTKVLRQRVEVALPYKRIELPRARTEDGALVAHALYVDRFGNVQLDAGHEDLAEAGLKLGRPVELHRDGREPRPAQFVRTFAEVERGGLLVYEDAYRQLALAVSHGDAAELLGIGVGEELRILPV